MIELVWSEDRSCCGSHRAADGVFPDGEVVSVMELDHGNRYAVRVFKDGMINIGSTRVSSGENLNMSEEDFNKLLKA